MRLSQKGSRGRMSELEKWPGRLDGRMREVGKVQGVCQRGQESWDVLKPLGAVANTAL